VKPRPALVATLLTLSAAALLAQPTSHERNPTVVFPGPGNYDVTLTVCDAFGACSSKTRTITVLDPAPHVGSALAQPTPVPIGHLVTLSATSSGKPPITLHWTVTAPVGGVTFLTGNPAIWSTAGLPPGAYAVDVRADSASGTASAHVGSVILVPDLPAAFWTLQKPCRLLDTRASRPLLSTDPPRVFPASTAACPVPTTAVAIAANVTAVDPSAAGFLTLFAGNDAPPLTANVTTDPRHPTRGSSAVIALSTDGQATFAARFGSNRPASVHVVVDVSGYFAPSRPAPPVALAFGAPLCPVFCIYPGGVPLVLRYQAVGTPTSYRYDWTGSGSFSQTSPTPLLSHAFLSSGYAAPKLQLMASGTPASTVAFSPPILITDPVPAAAPPAPIGVQVSFLGVLPPDPLDPAATGPQPAFAVSVLTPLESSVLGWNVYLSLDGAAWNLTAALPPDLTARAPLRLPSWNPSRHSARIAFAAVNWAAQGPLSAPLGLIYPATATLERRQKVARLSSRRRAQ
jgi:PKD repeat protein